MIAEEDGRQLIRLRMPAPADETRPWERPMLCMLALRWDPVRASVMTRNQLAHELIVGFAASVEALGRPGQEAPRAQDRDLVSSPRKVHDAFVDIQLATERLFLLDERITADEIEQRAMDKRAQAFGAGFGSLLQRVKPEEVTLVGRQRRLEPIWHVACGARYVYERKRDYNVRAARPRLSR